MIIFGILAAHGRLDSLIYEIKRIDDLDAVKIPREVRWKTTKVFDNSNRGQNTTIYKERCR